MLLMMNVQHRKVHAYGGMTFLDYRIIQCIMGSVLTTLRPLTSDPDNTNCNQ